MQTTIKRFTMYFVTLAALAAAMLLFPATKASAFTQSVSIGIDQVKSLTDNRYSEGTKQWTISNETVLELVSGQGTTTVVVKGVKAGSASVICKTYYTEWTTKYDSSLGIWVPTTQQGMVYSTFNVTVSETASEDTEITFSGLMLEPDTDEDGNVTLVSGERRVLLTSTVNEKLEWTSSDANVADVDNMGCIIAVKPGTATITINDPVYGSASKTITVISPEQAGYTPISTLDELKAISGVAGNYYLTNDIDFGGTSASIKLEGKFDGQGHTISGFISDSALFNSNGKQVFIENLIMKGCSVVSAGSSAMLLNVPSASSANYIINCHIVGGSVSADCDAAGLVCSYACTGDCTLAHSAKNNILLCTNSASVEGKQRSGGIASFNHGQIIFCENSGDISIKSGTRDSKGYCAAGGILGSDYMHWTGSTSTIGSYYSGSRVKYCTNKGNVSGLVAGGIAGITYGTRTERSTNYGTIKTDTTVKPYSGASGYGAYSLIGGITGRMSYGYGGAFSMIMYCSNNGSVLADDSNGVKFCSGGIVGYAYLNGNFGSTGTPIQHCFTANGGDYTNKYSGYSYTGGIIAALAGSQFTNYVATCSYAQGSSIVGTSSGTGCSYLYSDNVSYASKADIAEMAGNKLYNPNNDWTAVAGDYPVLTMEVNSEYGSKLLNHITYDTAGGTFADGEYVKAYYSDGTSYKLPAVNSPCGFVGWYTDSGFTDSIKYISPDVTGNLYLYAKVNHTCKSSVVKPTVDSEGYTLHTCTKCGYSYKDNYTEKLPVTVTPVPQNLTATAGDGKVVLTWDEVPGATAYTVKGGTDATIYAKSIKTNTATVTGLKNGTTYTFRVFAYVNGKWSAAAAVKATPVTTTPQNVKATAGDGKVVLTWDAVPGATAYTVKGGSDSTIYARSIKTNTTTVKGLTNGKEYIFRVFAYVDGKWGRPAAVKATPVTTTPQNLKAVAGNGKVTLSWSAVPGATAYTVKGGSDTTIYARSITANGYTVSGLKNGTTYIFRVFAYVNGKWSAAAVVRATPKA